MAAPYETYGITGGGANRAIRSEVIDAMIKQTAERSYKFKQALSINPTSAWKNTFYREDLTVLTGQSGNLIKGVPRGADFPTDAPSWTEISVRIVKHAIERKIFWEDIIAGDINVQARTVIRATEAVVKSVDDDIWAALTQNVTTGAGDSPTVIQSFAIDLAVQGRWDESSAAIVDNIMRAKQLIAQNGHYDVSDLICFVSPRDARSIANYFADKGTQWQPIATDIARNGQMGRIAGVTIVQSDSVSSSYALVVKPKTCATWNELVSLRSTTIDDPYKFVKIRVVEEGSVSLTDPLAECLIKNTQSSLAATT